MIGAIAGDILGSPWEGKQKIPDQLAFSAEGSRFTDDSVCTCAIAEALLGDLNFGASLRRWVIKYPGRGYGKNFHNWIHGITGARSDSFGNGAAMRVSPIAVMSHTLEGAVRTARNSALPSHNHPEAIRGAQAVTGAIWLALHGSAPSAIGQYVESTFGYDLNSSVRSARKRRNSSMSSSDTVPLAIGAALEADSFLSAVASAMALGEDTDTLACMAGGLAEAMFGLPDDIARATRKFIAPEMSSVLDAVYAHCQSRTVTKGY